MTLAFMGCTGPGATDAGAPDANEPTDLGTVDAAVRCARDPDCSPDQRCFAGACQPDPCASGSACDDDERCVARCVPVEDACADVTCEADETCIEGVCFAGCLPAPCTGRTCPEGRFCDVDGACRLIDPCRAECGDGAACHRTCVPRTACEGVTCGDDELCRDGACVPNLCAGVGCASGQVCNNGECVTTCDCEPACAPPNRCIGNVCVCTPSCLPGMACGEPDGCGGYCPGSCPGARDECDLETGECACTPRCPSDATCGEDDGCGGGCDGACTDGRTCIDGACECTDVCLDPEVVACGDPLPDTCLGSACPGTGERCGGSSECLDGACCPPCASVLDVACGVPIPDAVDSSGGVCRECSGLGARCTGGNSCLANPPGAPGERVCCGLCAHQSSVPCGEPIPDELDAEGAVCRVCSVAYGSGCPAGESCTGGPAGVCCEGCAAAAAVDCGEPIPDLACRACPGLGERCPGSTSCVSPPGSTELECCASCPNAAAVPCGTPIDPVLGADGEVCKDCGQGSMCTGTRVCHEGSCCEPSCTPASERPCGTAPSDGCGGVCPDGTLCALAGASCVGDPLRCECTPACAGRRCGESDGCGGECVGACDPGFSCTERPPPEPPGDYACEPDPCIMSCGLCESCVLGVCQPLECGPSRTACAATCDCCDPGEVCTASGCDELG